MHGGLTVSGFSFGAIEEYVRDWMGSLKLYSPHAVSLGDIFGRDDMPLLRDGFHSP